MAIKKLINPLTENYKQFKTHVNHQDFTWHWIENSVQRSQETEGYLNRGYYTNAFLMRPEAGKLLFPTENAPTEYVVGIQSVMIEILLANNIKPAVFYRISVNCEHPHESDLPNMLHSDHQFPHENLRYYFKLQTSVQTSKSSLMFWNIWQEKRVGRSVASKRTPLVLDS